MGEPLPMPDLRSIADVIAEGQEAAPAADGSLTRRLTDALLWFTREYADWQTWLGVTEEATTEVLQAIEAEQPGFDWTAERTADAIDTLTKLVLPALDPVAVVPTGGAEQPHPFVPGIDVDDPENPSNEWCNTCGERHPVPAGGEAPTGG